MAKDRNEIAVTSQPCESPDGSFEGTVYTQLVEIWDTPIIGMADFLGCIILPNVMIFPSDRQSTTLKMWYIGSDATSSHNISHPLFQIGNTSQ